MDELTRKPADSSDAVFAIPGDTVRVDVDLERVWAGIAAEVWVSPVGPLERLAGWLLRSPGLARALVTTPSLVLSWLVASAVVLAVGVLATYGTGTPWVKLLAPALAAVGLAYAYGPGIDPAFELSRSIAVSDRMVLLVRGLTVVGLNAALGLLASLFASGLAALSLGWLTPMTAISALALATAVLVRSAGVGVMVALLVWCSVVLASAVETGDIATAVVQGSLIPFYLLATAACLVMAVYATSGERIEAIQW